MSITLRGVSRRFGEFAAVEHIDLNVPTGALMALLGPSGCGKTTLLRLIAGLETPDEGKVYFDGEDATAWPIAKRRVGFVFQSYALFRHMTVFENVAFGLKVKRRRERPAAAKIRERVADLLALVQLEWAHDRHPAQLSGGQRQRVALARAMAVDPRVLLLDEPFGALDSQVRHELRRWLRRLHDELHFTSIIVTHDQQEALEVADTLVVLNRGRIEQAGIPGEIYDLPKSAFVHRFLGQVNELPVHWQGGRAFLGPLGISSPEGVNSSQGEHGAQGDQRAQREQPVQGEKGAQGVLVAQGAQGEQGAQGDQREQPVRGEKGAQGERRAQGERGAQGEQGEQGQQGQPGQPGHQVALIRPHEVEIGAPDSGWPATVVAVRVIGPIVRLQLCAEGQPVHEPLEAEISRERFDAERFSVGQRVGVRFRRWQVYPSAA